MSKVAGSAYGRREKVTPESMGHVERVAVRVLEAGSFSRTKKPHEIGGLGRDVYWFSTVEPHDHIVFLSGHDVREIVANLGDETNNWRGQQVVLELVHRIYKGETYEKYAIAPAGEWNDVLRPLTAPPPKSARKAPKRKTGKPRTRRK